MKKQKQKKFKILILSFLILLAMFVFFIYIHHEKNINNSEVYNYELKNNLARESSGILLYDQEVLLGNKKINTESFNSKEEYSNFINESYEYGKEYCQRQLSSTPSSDFPEGTNINSIMVDYMNSCFTEFRAMNDGSSEAEVIKAQENTENFSSTNNQVDGVDEGDLLKTNGKYIYTIEGNKTFIIKAQGNETKIISEISIQKETPKALLIYGNNLIIIGEINDEVFYSADKQDNKDYYKFKTHIRIYNLSDKSSPILIKETGYMGKYVGSRMIDEKIYLLSVFEPREYNNSTTPSYFDDTTKEISSNKIYKTNIQYTNPNVLTTSSIDAESGNVIGIEGMIVEGGGYQLYISKKDIYIAYGKLLDFFHINDQASLETILPKLSSQDQEEMDKILHESKDKISIIDRDIKINDIISNYMQNITSDEIDQVNKAITKLMSSRTYGVYDSYTITTRIPIDNGNLFPPIYGLVPGGSQNYFLMDEYNNTLRIVTSSQKIGNLKNNFVFQPTLDVYLLNQNLEIKSIIEDITKKNYLNSIKFVDSKVYFSYGKNIDFIRGVDLENPLEPKKIHTFKMPRQFNQFYLYENNTIIGIGAEGAMNGKSDVIHIGVFKIDNASRLKIVDEYVTNDQYKTSLPWLSNRQVLFLKDKNLLALQIYGFDYNEVKNNVGEIISTDFVNRSSGILMFNINKNKVSFKGFIDDSQEYYNNDERIIYIGNDLFTKDKNLLLVNSLDELKKEKSLELN